MARRTGRRLVVVPVLLLLFCGGLVAQDDLADYPIKEEQCENFGCAPPPPGCSAVERKPKRGARRSPALARACTGGRDVQTSVAGVLHALARARVRALSAAHLVRRQVEKTKPVVPLAADMRWAGERRALRCRDVAKSLRQPIAVCVGKLADRPVRERKLRVVHLQRELHACAHAVDLVWPACAHARPWSN